MQNIYSNSGKPQGPQLPEMFFNKVLNLKTVISCVVLNPEHFGNSSSVILNGV